MEEQKTKKQFCYVCDNTNFTPLAFGYKFHGKNLRALKCNNCGLIFIHPQPTQEEIKSLYEKDYFTSSDLRMRPHGRGEYFQSVESKKENKIYRNRLALFSKYVPKGKLLEIGCGPGHFLLHAKLDGWDVTGIEISEFAAEHARKEFKLNVITGTVDDVTIQDHSFNVIFMGDLLEHISNPKMFLAKIKNYLSDEGILFVEIPSVTNGLYGRFGNYFLKIMGKIKYINLPPYHLFEYTPNNCMFLFESSGYKIKLMKQKVVSPKDVGFRDSLLLNIIKLIIQSVNYIITYITGKFGDRITIVARNDHQVITKNSNTFIEFGGG